MIRIDGTSQGLAFSVDVTPRYCAADPYEGGKQAVAECWRNLTAVGAEPLALTDNLNFGNPERPEIMGELVGAIRGIGEACARPLLPGRVRQCVALQRDQRRRHSADSGDRRRRPARRRQPVRHPRLQGRGRDHLACRRAAVLGDASRPVDLSPRDPRPRGRPAAAGRPRPRETRSAISSAASSAKARSRRRTTCPTAASPSPWRRWQSPPGSAQRRRN